MKLSFKDGFMTGLGFVAAQFVSGVLSVLVIVGVILALSVFLAS
jgi:hypothetical protein